MDDLLREFLTETFESLDVVDRELVKLEQDPNNKEVLSNIFRLVHTIKGTCGFLGLPRLEAVAHASENVLGKIRDGALVVTVPTVTVVLASLDQIKEILAVLEATEAEPPGEDTDLIARLNLAAEGKLEDAPVKAAAPAPVEPVSNVVPGPRPAVALPPAPPPAPVAIVAAEADGPYDSSLGRALRPGEVSLDELEAAFAAAAGPEEMPAAATPKIAAVAHHPEETAVAAAPAGEARSSESSVANQSIRVSVDLLENLMTMVSELVLTRNQLMQMVRKLDDSEFAVPLQRLSHCTSELQESVMKTRMQPIGNAWAKLPRIVRDLGHELHKKIDLQMHGAETELDRQVLELIKDPLTHMVRNSADHGLETPAERRAAGKPETGRVTLDAFHEGGHIIISISDDGRGLNGPKILAKARTNGLVTEAEAAAMTDAQIHKLIFHPGLSTAEKVTSVSGRGVGMDVVKSNIEKIGGTVDVKSQAGRGSSFTIKIPLTLAIVSALIVECATERFAIPQISVLELVRASGDSEHRIELVNQTPVLRLRDTLLPLVYLDKVLGLGDPTARSLEEAFVIVSQVGAYTFGIVVDRVFDTEEIVVKPVAPILRHLSLFSGNTILGDGSVIMILDPNGIAAATADSHAGQSRTQHMEEEQVAVSDESVAMLLFRAGSEEPKAVPLALVARLEEFEAKDIERSNGRMVVQYRGRLMPLVAVSDQQRLRDIGRQPVIVFADDGRAMGLAVDEILDIIDEKLDVELPAHTAGMLGSAVLRGKATEVLDVGHFLTTAYPDWFERKGDPEATQVGGKRLLLVEDSAFFRSMLTPVLSAAGFEVTSAADAKAALRLREQNMTFDVIVSDIEMPGMSGFELAETVRAEGIWRETPIVALSSRSSPGDFERGRTVGFTDYVAKFDRQALLQALETVMREASLGDSAAPSGHTPSGHTPGHRRAA
ncbi:hybrid sensor histidine kinase/response regulator [Zavarzinia sp. CC-PAN008]|uniref:hybrid sensor histidine kinase/response regulator n=1 Tax=Zavarzinia sp. CC-PAN008 TaxID=3243332 RepID=UPI003F747BE5